MRVTYRSPKQNLNSLSLESRAATSLLKQPKFEVNSLSSTCSTYDGYNPYFVPPTKQVNISTTSEPLEDPEPYVPSMVTAPSPTSFIPIFAEFKQSCSSYRSVLAPARTFTPNEKVDRVPRTFLNDCMMSHTSGIQCVLTPSSPEVEEIMVKPKSQPEYTCRRYRDGVKKSKLAASASTSSTMTPPKHAGIDTSSIASLPEDKVPGKEISFEEGQLFDDGVIVLDLEDGEILSDGEPTPRKKISKVGDIRDNLSEQKKKKSSNKVVMKTEISLGDISTIRSDEEDDDCQLVAIVAPGKRTNSTVKCQEHQQHRTANFTGIGSKLSTITQFEQLRRRSLLRRQSASKLLAFRRPVNNELARAHARPILKRLKKSRWGTPIPVKPTRALLPTSQKRNFFGRYHNVENEDRFGKRRKRPLIPEVGMTHQVPRFSKFQTNLNNNSNGNIGPPAGRSNYVSRQPLGKPRPVIIDGSNVAIGHGNGKVFSCRGLEICVARIREKLRHGEIICFVPKFRAKKAESVDTHILDLLTTEGILKYTPSREVDGKHITSYDDRFILEYAAETGGIVITNDNFKDLYETEYKWRDTIKLRLLQYTWVNDLLMFPSDPLGKNGPNLDQFCSFGV